MSPAQQPLQPVVDLEVQPRKAEQPDEAGAGNTLQVFERLARDQSVDVDKLERLMQMHERASRRFAQEQFNAAMSAAQKEMRPIAADAYNPQTRSRYASYEALDLALRPIYTKHGFSLSFNSSDCPMPESVRVVCDVSHNGGHEKPYHLDMPADGKGAKGGDVMTRTHATGAAVQYGMRYLLKMIWNVAIGDGDDDGNAAGRRGIPEAPLGYDKWVVALADVSKNGNAAYTDAWTKSNVDFKNFMTKHDTAKWAEIKGSARGAK